MSISSNIISGDFTLDYRDSYLQNFRNIEKINYYIHDDYTLLDYAGNMSWEHWDGHQRFIEDVFINIDPLIDLDFSRTTERSKAHIEIYQVSPESPFADDGLSGQALGSHQVDNLNLIGFPKSKGFGFYRMAAWSMSPNLSPFLDDQNKYDLVKFNDAYTILHVLGHTLGVSHPQSGGDDPSGSWHTSRDTVMSYNSTPEYNKWGIYSLAPRWTSSDISALQTLWGLENDNKTYTITPSASSINEGSAFTISIAAKNVASGTILYYTLSGNGITVSDFSSGALSGSGLVGSNGAFSFTHTLASDLTTEGVETLNIKLFSDSSRATQVGSTATVSIADTSKALPTYTLTPSASTINEGSTLTTTVSTNVASGTTLYYSLSGTGITSTDFSSGALTGLGSVASNGSFSFSHTLANDLATEGTETLNIKLFSDSSRSIQVGSTASVSIVDTSKSAGKTYAIRTFSAGQWVDTFSEGDWIGVQVNTTNVLDGTVLYFSLSGIGINAGDLVQLGAVELLPVKKEKKGVSQFYRQLANDLKTEGIETLYIKLFSDSLRTIEVGSKAVSILDTSLALTYYNPSTNKSLNSWTAYLVINSVKAGDIVSQWFGTAPPATQQIQDISDIKLMDVVATTWADKVKINRVIKASDTGGKIEAKQIDFGAGEVAGSVISGGNGNDDIKGFAGWDFLDGGAGDDLIHGGNGRDILTGGVGRDELHGDFGWNTYRSEKDGVSDLIAIKSDQFLVNWLYGKAGNSPNGEKSDIIEGLDSIDKIKIIGVDISEITFVANVSAKGVIGIGIYGKGILEALYTGGNLTLAQIQSMTSGDASAAAMSNSVNAYGVW